MGIKVLCVKNDKVFAIPVNQMEKNRTIVLPELAGQTVLKMLMVYQNKNRIPFQIEHIEFERITFDNDGVYDMNKVIKSEEFRARFQYVNRELHEMLAKSNGNELNPLPVPRPTSNLETQEINSIKSYLKNKFPQLLKNSPNAIEQAIERELQIHNSQVQLMKESYRVTPKTSE